jgi:hypothetical protein
MLLLGLPGKGGIRMTSDIAVLWSKRHKRRAVSRPNEGIMSAIFQVMPVKWAFLAPCFSDGPAVRCDPACVLRSCPHGKDTRESTPAARPEN